MKRIDLHIHTYKTSWDPQNFDFDIEILKSYVQVAEIDCIAITNHNNFYMNNYKDIESKLDITVLPGIELNITNPGGYGHLLIIADKNDLDNFYEGSQQISQAFEEKESIEWDFVLKVFPNIQHYLIIPHYIKSKQLDKMTINKINQTAHIDALEVNNNKHWLLNHDKAEFPLVVFSDGRPGMKMPHSENEPDGHRYAYGFTYIECDEMSVSAIKKTLKNRENVQIFDEDHNFEILPERIPASSRLNVVLGLRSSGKSYTLKRIMDAYDPNDYFYLEQFAITREASEENFENIVREDDNQFFTKYFRPLQTLIDEYIDKDENTLKNDVVDYCQQIINYANSPSDNWSERPIYQEKMYAFASDNQREKQDTELRLAIKTLHQNKSRKEIIEKYISSEDLVNIDRELRDEMLADRYEKWRKEKTNKIIKSIKKAMENKSVRKPLPDTNVIVEYFQYCYYEYMLSKAIDRMSETKVLKSEHQGKFKKTRVRKAILDAGTAREKVSRSEIPTHTNIGKLFKQDNSIDKLKYIRNLPLSVISNICRLLFDIESNMVLDDGKNTPLSGGQRAEYLFIRKLEQARGKDIALIDEPESSFDNIFLNTGISQIIQDLSDSTTVFLVTHNNTLGVSIHPDWIIYTSVDDNGKYNIHSGSFTSTYLASIDKNKVNTSNTLLDIMEAGLDAYNDRMDYYGINENK